MAARRILAAARTANVLRPAGRQLDAAALGPTWLADGRIARLVRDALIYGGTARDLYDLFAWRIVPNHVHVVWQPHVAVPKILQWLKGRTARRANAGPEESTFLARGIL
jgi:Transposase IS200 like